MEMESFFPIVVIFARILMIRGSQYTHHVSLDVENKYQMWWRFNDTDITFKVQVATTGWISWGLSPNGKMKGSDIVLGWIDANGVHFDDRHATGYSVPTIDKNRNYNLLGMSESNGKTEMEFSRKIKLCNDEDFDITSDTIRVIYAWSDDDPRDYAINRQIHYHSKRGTKSLFLLDYGDQSTETLTETYKTHNLRMSNSTIPGKNTVYWCKSFKLPELKGKHHLFRIDTIITKGNEDVIHHMALYQCETINKRYFGYEHDCFVNNMPDHVPPCRFALIHAWATGGSNFYFPKEAGLSLGTPGDPKYVLLEIHYNNPSSRKDIVDSSGIRFYYSDQLRQYDAALLYTGVVPTKPLSSILISQIIPQGQNRFTSYGFCSSKCLDIDPTQVPKIFGVMLHTHVHGKEIVVRLVRDSDGVETKRISQDLNYDFNFQEYKYLREPIDMTPGHSIHVECTYDTQNMEKPLLSGLGTQQEMCNAFVYYYPKINTKICLSHTTSFLGWPKNKLGWKINSRENIISPVTINGRIINATHPIAALMLKDMWDKNNDLVKDFEKAGEMDPYWKMCEYGDYSLKPWFIEATFHKQVTKLKDVCRED